MCAKRRYGQLQGHGGRVHCVKWSSRNGVCEDVQCVRAGREREGQVRLVVKEDQ